MGGIEVKKTDIAITVIIFGMQAIILTFLVIGVIRTLSYGPGCGGFNP
jgi:hypothetical protein